MYVMCKGRIGVKEFRVDGWVNKLWAIHSGVKFPILSLFFFFKKKIVKD